MCDSEHMFECPVRDFQSHGNDLNEEDLDLDRIMEELTEGEQHKNLVAKKFHTKKVNIDYNNKKKKSTTCPPYCFVTEKVSILIN